MSGLLDRYGREIKERSTLSKADEWLIDALGGSKSAAGERVTTKTAMTVMAFFACVRNIAEDITKLPKRVIRQNGAEIEALPRHPVSVLLKNPSRILDRHTFWLTYSSHALSQRGGYAYIVRENGVPVEMLLLDPKACEPFASEETGEPMIRAYGQVLFGSEVLHLRGLGERGIGGFDASEILKQVLGAAIAMQKMRGSFFGNGMMPSGILKHPATLTSDAKVGLLRSFQQNFQGADNGFGLLLLDEGFDYKQLSIDPEKSDFSALNQISILDICRYFRMPPTKIQDLTQAHYANVEELSIDYARDTIDPWVDRLRSEVDFKLLTRREREQALTCDVNLKALERGNMAARKDFYNFMYYSGCYNANRILELEHENPVPEGDRYFVQRNLIPADRVDDVEDKATQQPGAAGPAPQPQQPSPSRVLRKMLAAKIDDLLREELRTIEAAAGKKRDWEDWYGKRSATVRAHLTPYLSVCLEELGVDSNASDLAGVFATELCNDGRELRERHEFTEWRSGERAAQFAAYIMTALEDRHIEDAA